MVFYSCLQQKISGSATTRLLTCRSKSTGSTFSVFNNTNFLDGRCFTPLQNKLSNTIAFLDFKVFFAMIEQNDFDFTGIIRIDDTRTDVDTMLYRETRPRCHAPVYTGWKNDCNTGSYESSASLARNHGIFGAI